MAYIYKITNLINGKIYVGKSEREDSYHRKNYFGSGVIIRLAIKKYGCFEEIEILSLCNSSQELN